MDAAFLANCKTVDLTHTLDSKVPTWDGSCGFHNFITVDYSGNESSTKFLIQRLEMRAGIGTHMDSPRHCYETGKCIADLDLSQLAVPLVVLDVSSKADENYQISAADVKAFEKKHGTIAPRSLVIGHSGWSRYWNDPVAYRNADDNGRIHFPSYNIKAAELLLERGVAGIGIDTLSPDLGNDGHFPVHELILGAGKYLIENIANAHLLPPTGAFGIVLPMKIADGAEAPVRFIAFI